MARDAKSLFALIAFALLPNGIASAVEREPPSVSGAVLPGDVTAHAKRRADCNHWAGEDAYDAARGRQIAAAFRKLGCDRLDADEKNLRRRYQSSPDVVKALDKARDADG